MFRRRDDDGFSLAELLVAMVVLMIALSIVAGMMISSSAATKVVRQKTDATSSAQTAANAIEKNIRNSTGFTLTSVGTDQLLRARVANDSGVDVTWKCVAWYWDESAGELRYKQVEPPAVASGSPAIAAPTAAQLATWSAVAAGLKAPTGTAIFVGTQAPSVLDTGLTINFNAEADGTASTHIRTQAMTRTSITGGTC